MGRIYDWTIGPTLQDRGVESSRYKLTSEASNKERDTVATCGYEEHSREARTINGPCLQAKHKVRFAH